MGALQTGVSCADTGTTWLQLATVDFQSVVSSLLIPTALSTASHQTRGGSQHPLTDFQGAEGRAYVKHFDAQSAQHFS